MKYYLVGLTKESKALIKKHGPVMERIKTCEGKGLFRSLDNPVAQVRLAWADVEAKILLSEEEFDRIKSYKEEYDELLADFLKKANTPDWLNWFIPALFICGIVFAVWYICHAR